MIYVLLFFLLNISSNIYSITVQQQSLQEFMQSFPESSNIECTNNYTMQHPAFPLYPEHATEYFPSQITFENIFIVKTPNACVHFDNTGYFYINNCFIKETQIRNLNFFNSQNYKETEAPYQTNKISGKVAIISHLYPYCYAHWLWDVLTQLAILEINHIDYDYLITPYDKKFMKESLDLWGIDPDKIISCKKRRLIYADEIIFCTPTSRCKIDPHCCNYYIDFLLNYVRQKLIQNLDTANLNNLPKKIFISRKDTCGKRATINEDEIFALFEPLGYARYQLTDLSFQQQIALFYNAQSIVSFVGSGGANIIFCQPNTQYIEIIKTNIDATFFYLADTFKLKYLSINDSSLNDLFYGGPQAPAASISINCIKDFLKNHPEL